MIIESKLEQIFDTDQNAIKDFRAGILNLERWKEIHRENTEYVLGLVKRGFFPYKNIVSEKAYNAFFLVVQHSEDTGLMKEVAGSILKADTGRVSKAHYAYLVDRIRTFEGKPQLYGTQFKKEEGAVTFLAIEDPANIDARRAELGMESFEEYKKKTESY
jgi:catechol 2,3-dioxygenase-like lactoylglutathione lyase family enzyme